MNLGTAGVPAYDSAVVAEATTRCRNRISTRRVAPPDCGLFYARSNHRNGGLRGATERLAGVLVGQFTTPALVRHTPCRKGCGGFQPTRKPL